ncbi:MAG: alpha/beta hydrolase [Chloroflexota bacterium]
MIDVGGYRLHLWGMGEHHAGPAVILESGIWSTCLDWCRVQPHIAAFAPVYSYDRAGFGWSETGSGGRTSRDRVQQLHALLNAAHVLPPFILVGHSFGGLNMRLFAATYPDEVAGMVLVDATPATLFDHRPDYLRALRWQLWRQRALSLLAPVGIPRLLLAAGLHAARDMGYPPEIKSQMKSLHAQTRALREVYREGAALPRSVEQIRELPVARSARPLIVITRRKDASQPGDDALALWHTLQRDPLALSDESRQIVSETSGHYVQLDEPHLIVDAVRSLVDRVARPIE